MQNSDWLTFDQSFQKQLFAETPVLESLFNKVTGLKASNFKKRPQHSLVYMVFCRFLIHPLAEWRRDRWILEVRLHHHQLTLNVDPRTIFCLLKWGWIAFQSATKCYSAGFFLLWRHSMLFESKSNKLHNTHDLKKLEKNESYQLPVNLPVCRLLPHDN